MIARILVIKHGALGDIVLAMGPFAAIRNAHRDAHITLMTTGPYEEFARTSGYFDSILVDPRPGPLQPWGWLNIRRQLRAGRFDRVYDLQTSDRTAWYFRLMGPGPRPEWSGIARGCSHPHANPGRNRLHSIERQRDQLAMAGVGEVPCTDLSWAKADVSRFALPDRFVLMVPGGAAHRPRKRWPAANFARLAETLPGRGVRPVILGTAAESDAVAEILAACPEATDLSGRTAITDLAALARDAAAAVGNDTGPMHIIAAAGCPSVVLFSSDSDPEITRPRGPSVTVLQRDNLGTLPVSEVAGSLSLR